MFAILGILHRNIQGGLCHADGAGSGLDARAFKSLHQLLKALPLLAAQKVLALHLEIVEAKFIFFHAAITQDLDLAARHTCGGEGVFVIARCFFGQEHRQATVIGGRGVSAGQEGHDMGA